jgi:hypothetical protein
MRHLTAGCIDAIDLRRFAECPDPEAAVTELVAVGFWEETPEGWQIVHHMEHQPDPETVLHRRANTAARMRRKRKRDAEAAAARNAALEQAESEPYPRNTLRNNPRNEGRNATRNPGRDGSGREGLGSRTRKASLEEKGDPLAASPPLACEVPGCGYPVVPGEALCMDHEAQMEYEAEREVRP